MGHDTPRLVIVAYNPEWPAWFETEARRLRTAMGPTALRIEHHGSTAVPGLAAKPVIDIQISVAALQPMDRYRLPLQALGYTHLPHADDAMCPFFFRPGVWPHTHHVHVVQAGGLEERRTLAFRDWLREHPETANQYEALKRRLAHECDGATAESREAYALAKTDFVEAVTQKALSHGYPRTR